MKLNELKVTWRTMYEDDKQFPSDIIFLKDISTMKLPPAQHSIHPVPPSNDKRVYDTKTHALYDIEKEVAISNIKHALYKKYQVFVAALKKNMTYQQCQLFSEHTKMLTASFAAAHPQDVPTTIQL